MNHFQIDLDINQFIIKRLSFEKISTCNRSHIFVSFCFDSPWRGVEKMAVFRKKGLGTVEVPIVNNCCLIPKEFTMQEGIIKISVYGGNLETLNHVEIEVIQCSCQVPKDRTVVKSPDGTIRYIRQKDNCFEYYAKGRWHTIAGGSGTQVDWEQEDVSKPDYVKNRPKINDVILTGNRKLPEIAITNLEIEEMFSNQV